MATKKKFPETLLVRIEDEGDDSWFAVDEEVTDLPDEAAGEPVAVYKLVKVGTVEVTKTFVEK